MEVELFGYTIRDLEDGTIWICLESGEGMQIKKSVFIEFLNKFYDEHF